MHRRATTSTVPHRRLIRLPDVIARTSLSKSTIWRHARRGAFPKSVPLTPGTVGWVEAEVEGWIAARIASRDAWEGTAAKAQSARA